MSCIDESFFDEVVTRIQSAEWRVTHLSERLRLIEDRCALSHGLTWCERCGRYLGPADTCTQDLCAIRSGSD